MRIKVELTKNSVVSEMNTNTVESKLVFVHSNYYFVSPYGSGQENEEVEG